MLEESDTLRINLLKVCYAAKSPKLLDLTYPHMLLTKHEAEKTRISSNTLLLILLFRTIKMDKKKPAIVNKMQISRDVHSSCAGTRNISSSKPFHYKLKKEELKETLDIADEDSEIFRRMLYVGGLLLEYDVIITII